jgi:hypothetical protein
MELGVYKRLVFKPTLFKWRPHTSNQMFQNAMQPCGLIPWPWIYVNYIMWVPRTNWEFIIHTFRLNLEIWVELCSRNYAQELLFIPRIFTQNIVHPSIVPFSIHMIIIIENTDTIHNVLTIQTNINHRSY